MKNEDAIRLVKEVTGMSLDWDDDHYEALQLAINALSSEAVQGEWIKHKGEWVGFDFYPTKYECSQCHYYIDDGCDSNFCPNCGARMKGGAE